LLREEAREEPDNLTSWRDDAPCPQRLRPLEIHPVLGLVGRILLRIELEPHRGTAV